MTIDLLGPGSATNSTTVQPTDSVAFGATDTWFQDCPPNTTSGGTFMSALWFNRMLQQIRNAIRGMGLPTALISNSNPNMLLEAIQMAGKNPPFGVDSSTTAGQIVVTLSPAVPSFNAGDHIEVQVALTCPGASNITVTGVGTYNITHNDKSATVQNDYVAGQILDLRFDGTEFQLGRSVQPAAGSITATMLASGAAPLGYVGTQTADNLHLSNDATNTTRDINVSVGRVRDDADVTNLVIASAMAKRLDTAWAAGGLVGGTSQGACDTGTKGNSQTWHVYLIGKLGIAVSNYSRTSNVASIGLPTGHGLAVGSPVRVVGIGSGFDGVQTLTAVTATSASYNNGGANVSTASCTATLDAFDILASQSYPSPTMPSGWTAKQCLGAVVTDTSGNIRAFIQTGDRFLFTAPINDYPAAAASLPRSVTTSLPKGVSVLGLFQLDVNAATNGVDARLYSTWQADSSTPQSVRTYSNGAPNVEVIGMVPDVATDTSGNIRLNAGLSTYTIAVWTLGWRDPRRRLF